MYHFEKIRKLHSEGKDKSQIARQLGINWKTVDKYLRCNTPPRYKPRLESTRIDPFDGFLPRVKSLLEVMPDLSDREVFEYLWSEGYRGSERTVNRRLSQLREEKPKERFFEQKYVAGEQAQFDFKEKVEFPFCGGPVTTYLHVSSLPYSGANRVRCYPSTNFECFIDGVHQFFHDIGGRSTNIRIDNLSACVAKVLKNNDRTWTKAFKGAIDHYGFGVLPCSPGRGNEKGDVERDIRTLAGRIRHQVKLQGIVFDSWDHVNGWLMELCLKLQSEKSKNLFEEEKKHLQPLSGPDENVLSRVEYLPVSAFGTVRIFKGAYSVPDRFIGMQLKVVPTPYQIRIYNRRELIAVHQRRPEGENGILLEHILPSLVRKPRAMVRWSHRQILFPTPIFEDFYKKLVRLDPASAEREFLKSINLVHHASLSDIAAGLELVMAHHETNFFEHLKELLLNERRPTNLIELRPINPKLTDYDCFIPTHKQKESV